MIGDPAHITAQRSSRRFVRYLKLFLILVVLLCGILQYGIDDSLTNVACTFIAVIMSSFAILYVADISRFRRSPMSSMMVLGFNVSAFSGALIIQTADWRSLIYNLSSASATFLSLAAAQLVATATHWVYLHSSLLMGVRHAIARRVFRPLGLLRPLSEIQLWCFGLLGCAATMLAARTYTENVEFGDASSKFFLGFVPFSVAPFFIPLRATLLGGEGRSRYSNILLVGYALLLIAVAMANNARATFSSGFLTLGLCVALAVFSGNLAFNRRALFTGALMIGIGIPIFVTLSDLSTAMVIARDERSNVSSGELIALTLSNFQDKALIADRRQRDAAVLGGDYNENYVTNPIFARFVYTKFTDVNMTNAIYLTPDQVAQIRQGTWMRIVAMLPTPILNYLTILVDKADIGYSSGDIYSYIARGLELGGYTTGSEVPDGLTVFGQLFWPVLAIFVLMQFLAYDALAYTDPSGRRLVSPAALLNIQPVFTLGVMQESVANQVIAIFRGIPQLIALYLVVAIGTHLIERVIASPFGLSERAALD